MTAIGDSTATYTMRPLDIERDAEQLARMWNESDDQWPGTVTDGVPMTPERAREFAEREVTIEKQIWDSGDAIMGYCSFRRQLDEPNVTYIGTLNVAPAYQGLGLGRRFLTYFVGRAIEEQSVRLDLHTWAGNLKAVPLYKKCGFFWMPGTSVHMYNFLPTILTMPLAQPFFARHDWYTSLVRELNQNEDDERWQGMKVFAYRFERDGEQLTVWGDRQSCTIAGIETDTLFAAAIAPEIEPPRGLPTPLRWRISNKSDQPLPVSLIATGTEQLTLDYRTTMELAPGETRELEALVQVAPTAEAKEDKPAPALRSLLVLGGQLLELGTGLLSRLAVETTTEPGYVTLAPAVASEVELRLRSRLKQEATATVSVAPGQYQRVARSAYAIETTAVS